MMNDCQNEWVNTDNLNLYTYRCALQNMTFEKIVAKGEIAHYEQFLLLPQCFKLDSKT